jgi:hypothetical protein
MQKRLIVLFGIVLMGCNSLSVPAPAPAASNYGIITKQFQDAWNNCVTGSYQRALVGMKDKNEAVERAFAACKSEEDEIVALDAEHFIPPGVRLHYKSQAKVVLIEDPNIQISTFLS